MRRTALALAALPAAPAAAAAAPPWSDPQPLAPPAAVLSAPRVDGPVQSAQLLLGERRLLAVQPGDRLVSSALPSPVLYGATRVLHLRERDGALGVSLGRTDGTIGEFRPIAPRFTRAVVDADARGNAVVAWLDRGRVLVARRRAEHAFARAETIRGAGTSTAVAVAVGDGRAVVAWQHSAGGERRIEGRPRRRGRRGPPRPASAPTTARPSSCSGARRRAASSSCAPSVVRSRSPTRTYPRGRCASRS